jgi:asparagine synthase (glutamine-hydrolysing)
MGGLCGFIGQSDKQLLEAMCNLLSHRGCRTDRYIDDDISFAVRAIDNEAKIVRISDHVMAFQGEIYNPEDIQNQFVTNKIDASSAAEATSVLQLFDQKDVVAFEKIRGRFALAVWKASEKELTLARDHFGQDTMYYCRIRNGLFFASEIRPLLYAQKALLPTSLRMSFPALRQYLQYGYVPSPNTLFDNVSKLPAASYLRCKQGGEDGPHQFWAPCFATTVFNESEVMKRVYDTIQEIIRLGTRKHKRFSVLLSGGLDSSLLASLVRKCTDAPINSYTFTPPGQKNPSAESIADLLNLTYRETTMDAKDAITAFTVLPKIYADLISDPFIALPTYALAEAARNEGALFAADGADNIFWGLPSLYDSYVYVRRVQRLPSAVRRMLLKLLGKFNIVTPYQRSVEILLAASLSESPYMCMNSVLSEREVMKLVSISPSANLSCGWNRAPSSTVSLADFYRTQLVTGPDRPANISRIGPICSSFMLKLFEPFLDIKLSELANRIPPKMKQPSRNMDKLILRRTAQHFDLLPKSFHQRKMGLSCPLDWWYEKDLKEWVKQLLSDKLPPFLNKYYVRSLLGRKSLIDRMYSGSMSHRTSSRDIFTLVMFTLWFEEYSPYLDF